MLTPMVVVLALAGAGWGFVADRVGARWPAHEDGSVRGIDWRTGVVVVVGAIALGGLTVRFDEPAAVIVFGPYLAALVLLIATDLDQRLLPNVITLPAIPLALLFAALGYNPLVQPAALPITIVVAVVIPLVLFAISIPFGAGALGQGDVKLLVSVGLMAGAYRMFTGVVYGALLAGVVLVVLLVLHRITLKTYVPFGPFLILGGIWAILAAP